MHHTHAGHRARLKQRAAREGVRNFQPHELIELVLFPSLPLRDLNPLAHNLIDRFGSVHGVLHAPAEDLADVNGMGIESVAWLKLLCEAADRYGALKGEERPRFERLWQVTDYCKTLFLAASSRNLGILSLDMNGRLLSVSLPQQRKRGARDNPLRLLMEPVIRSRAQSVVLVFDREAEDAVLRPEEIELTRRFSAQLSMLNILLLDSVIMMGDKSLSMRRIGLHALPGERTNPGTQPMFSEPPAPFDHWLDER